MAVFSGNGSNTAPSFTFSSDTNTGMYRVDADKLGLVTNGANALTIDSAQKVGIGLTDPTGLLQLRYATDVNTSFRNSSAASLTAGTLVESVNNAFSTFTPFYIRASEFGFGTDSAGTYVPRVTVNSSGQMGVGVTPAVDGVSSTTRVRAVNGSDYHEMVSSSTTSESIITSPSYRMKVGGSSGFYKKLTSSTDGQYTHHYLEAHNTINPGYDTYGDIFRLENTGGTGGIDNLSVGLFAGKIRVLVRGFTTTSPGGACGVYAEFPFIFWGNDPTNGTSNAECTIGTPTYIRVHNTTITWTVTVNVKNQTPTSVDLEVKYSHTGSGATGNPAYQQINAMIEGQAAPIQLTQLEVTTL